MPGGLRNHIAALARRHPAKAALISCTPEGDATETISYAELEEKIEAAGSYILGLGLNEGDRLALAFGNSAELLILSWAAWALGIVTVPLDVKRDTGELYEYKIKLNDAKVLIAQKGIVAAEVPGVRTVAFSGFPADDVAQLPWKNDVSHLALILFTSGTTGNPKGAKLSLKNLLVNAEGIREWLRITEDDVFLVNLPLHHINSTTFCLPVLLAGGTIAVPPGYSNSHFWAQAAKTGATITSIVQSILYDQLSRTSEFAAVKDRIKLSRIQIGSAPVVAQSVLEFEKKYGIPLYQGYGQTETALRVTGVPMDLPEALYKRIVEENSIGVPMRWADVRIADENGTFLGEGEEGELVVRGEAVMEAYVAGESAFREGYFLTGDIGLFRVIEGRTYFFLKGRKKEIIIKGGINISPAAVENHLKSISDDIAQAYVVGVPDERYGEEVAAVICWKEGIDTGRALRRLKFVLLCGTAKLSAYETPKYIAEMTQEDLPTTSTGKVQRMLLKKTMPRERFGSIYELARTPTHTFSLLNPHSPLVGASLALHNKCWQPLTVSEEAYRASISKHFILLATDAAGHIAGQIAFIRTNLSESALLETAYARLLDPVVADPHGNAIVCISICSDKYTPKEVYEAPRAPSTEEVRRYVERDPVFLFHARRKGGGGGARLIDVIQGGRPEDRSSCGYTMLLKYPTPAESVRISEGAPVSDQLIEAVQLIARDIGIQDVYAYSRPGGLASYIAA